MVSVTPVNADGRTEPHAGAARLGGAVCTDITSVSGVKSIFGLAVRVAKHLSRGFRYVVSAGTTDSGCMFSSDNMADLRLSCVCDRRTIVVASGRLTVSGLETMGVGVDIRAAGTKPN